MTGEFVDDFFANCFPQLFPAPKHSLITLFGGEPLLPKNREAIFRILAHVEKLPFSRINVATNGTTLSRMLDLIGPEKRKEYKAFRLRWTAIGRSMTSAGYLLPANRHST